MNVHPEKNTLVMYLYNELSKKEMESTADHLSRCEQCQKELAILQESQKFYQRLKMEEPPADVLPRLIAERKALNLKKTRKRPSSRFLNWKIAAVLCLFLLGGLIYISYITLPTKPPLADADAKWKDKITHSLRETSNRVSRLDKSPSSFYVSGDWLTLPREETLEAKISLLHSRTKTLSESISLEKF